MDAWEVQQGGSGANLRESDGDVTTEPDGAGGREVAQDGPSSEIGGGNVWRWRGGLAAELLVGGQRLARVWLPRQSSWSLSRTGLARRVQSVAHGDCWTELAGAQTAGDINYRRQRVASEIEREKFSLVGALSELSSADQSVLARVWRAIE